MDEKYKSVLALADNIFDNSTPEKPAWHSKPKHHRWDYVDGCMLKAAMDLYFATKNNKYLDFTVKYTDHFVQESGNIEGYDLNEYNIDHINGGKMLFDLYRATGNDKYKKAIELLYSQLQNHPRTKEGNFWHKQIYPNQIWLDGLFMAQPFYIEYDMMFGGKKVVADSISQFKNVFRLMKDDKTGLFYHGYDESKEMFWCDKKTGLSPGFWTRAMGWYAMALADTADKLDAEFKAEKEMLGMHLKELIDALLKFLSPEKMFYQVTDKGHLPGNYNESSGTLGIAYSMMKGAGLGLLPVEYQNKGKEIFDAVVSEKIVDKGGIFVLEDTCLVSGLGGMPGMGSYKLRDGSYEYYISEPRVDNDGKGVGPLLYALAEIMHQ